MTSLHKIYKLQAKLLSEIEKEREFIEKSIKTLQKESRKTLLKRKHRGLIRSKRRRVRRFPRRIKITR